MFAWTPVIWVKMTVMAVLGVGVGMFFTSYCLVVVEVLGLPLLTPVLSISGVFKGTFVIVFGPFVGESFILGSDVFGGSEQRWKTRGGGRF